MIETENLNWDDYATTDTITKKDHEDSEDIGWKLLVGKFVCTISEVTLKESASLVGLEVNLKMVVNHVIEVNQAVIGSDGKPVMRKDDEGLMVPLEKKLPVPPDRQKEFNDLYCGGYIFDRIKYPQEDQKGTALKRRLFIAKRLELITIDSTAMPLFVWRDFAPGKSVIVETEQNKYTNRAGVQVVTAQVAWDGYTTLRGSGFESFVNSGNAAANGKSSPVDNDDAFEGI